MIIICFYGIIIINPFFGKESLIFFSRKKRDIKEEGGPDFRGIKGDGDQREGGRRRSKREEWRLEKAGRSSRGTESSWREEKKDPLRLSSSSFHSRFDTKVCILSLITLLVICYVFGAQMYIIDCLLLVFIVNQSIAIIS